MTDNRRINDIIKNMTLAEKVGQLCVPILQEASVTDELRRFVCDYHIGMIRYCPNAEFDNSSEVVGAPNKFFTPAETAEFINSIQKLAKIPLFFAVDQEGGSRNDVNRAGAFAYGGHMEFGAADDAELTYKIAKATGREFAAMGINVVQAPIVDVLTYAGRRTMKAATFGDNTDKVCEHALAMMRGFHDGGVMAMAKHFPGYGSVSTDAHKGIAEITKELDVLETQDIKPMKVLFENGLGAVMTGHVVTHCIDNENPATVSKKVITEYLRETLGFDGIVETDAMRMPAIQKLYGTGKASVMAVQAGCDLVLLRGNEEHFREGYNAIYNAVENGEISIERIDKSLQRILREKERIGLLDDIIADADKASEIVGCSEHRELARMLAENAVTMLKKSQMPVKSTDKILVICCEMQKIRAAMDEIQCVDMLEKAVRKYFPKTDGMIVPLAPVNEDIAAVEAVLTEKEYDAVVFASCNAVIYESQCIMARRIRENTKNLTVIAMESPYDYEIMPEAECFICTYGVSAQVMEAAAKMLAGLLEKSAEPPVHIKGFRK